MLAYQTTGYRLVVPTPTYWQSPLANCRLPTAKAHRQAAKNRQVRQPENGVTEKQVFKNLQVS